MKLKRGLIILLACVSVVLTLEIFSPIHLISYVLAGSATPVGHYSNTINFSGGIDMEGRNIIRVGSLGIGTSTPSARLEIYGGGGSWGSPAILIDKGVASDNVAIGIKSANQDWEIASINSNGNLIIREHTNSKDVLILSDSGTIGMGTAPTSDRLTVSGNLKADKFIGNLQGNADRATRAEDGPSGSWCGLAEGPYFKGTGQLTPLCYAYLKMGTLVFSCKGQDPQEGCPTGYSTKTIYAFESLNKCAITCVKD